MMDATTELPPPTSDADTRQTEPEVVAGIASGEGSPDMPLSIRTDRPRYGLRAMLLLIGGTGLGIAAARLLRRP
jgi:hypothetical protein